MIEKLGKEKPDPTTGDYPLESYKKYDGRATRLKWLLRDTMGCPNSFEFRRKEMALMNSVPLEQITDDAVADNFYDSVAKSDGFVRQYLEHAQVAARIGNTLFVHGGVDSLTIGFVPSTNNQDALQENIVGEELKDTHSVQEWIDCLNKWGRESLEDWKKNPKWDSTRTKRGGTAIMGYGYKAAMKGRTVIVIDFFKNGHPHLVSQDVCDYLKKSGIERVVVGHRPFGDSPTVLKSHGVDVFSADTSYSDSSKPDNRGCAVGELCIQGELHNNRTFCHGIISTGEKYEFYVGDPMGDPLIGNETPSGWWVKAKLKVCRKDGTQYLLSRGDEHKVFYEFHSQQELEKQFSKT